MAWLRLLGAALLIAGLAADAGAHGRPYYTNGVHFRPADAQSLYVATTFGFLVSHDDGCTFSWVCDLNIGYSDVYDPKYAIAADGAIFATSYGGLRVSRDGGCSFSTATADKPAGDPGRIDISVDAIDIGPTGDVWVATAESGKPNEVFRSVDNGLTFAPRGMQTASTLWTSVRAAGADPQRVFLAGHGLNGTGQMPPVHLFRTDNAGALWTEVAMSGVALAMTPDLELAAVSPTDRDVVLLVSVEANGPGGDRLYRSSDAGASFHEVLAVNETITNVIFRDADHVLVTTLQGSVYASADGGVTLARQDGVPHLSCIGQRSDGKLFACGPNWDPDFMAVASSTDATTWKKVWRFVNIAGALECPAGTAQHDVCEVQYWPMMETNLAPSGPVCGSLARPVPDAGASSPPPGGGCCGTSKEPVPLLSIGLVAFVVVRRRRR